MKKTHLLAILIIPMLLSGCASGSNSSTGETATSTVQPSVTEAAKKEYSVTIDNCKIATNYDDKECILVDFTFTNNSSENIAFGSILMAKAFQDGVQLDSTVGVYDENDDSKDLTDTEYKEIQPGTTLQIHKAFITTSKNPIDVEVEDFMGDKLAEHNFTLQ